MFERRLSFMYLCLCAGLLLIAARLAHLQVLQRTAEDPDAVLLRPLPLDEVPAPRGRILDRNGVLLACDDPVLTLAMDYREMLLLHVMYGGDLSRSERTFLRRYVRARRSEARRPEYPRLPDFAAGPNASPRLAELDTIYAALQDEPDPKAVDEMPARAQARLDALNRVTGRPVDLIQRRIENVIAKVRAIHAALPKVQVIYEETIPWEFVDKVSVDGASYVEANPDLFPAVSVRMVHKRSLPLGNFASHVLGELREAPRPQPGQLPDDPNVRPGEWIGATGVEKQYNFLLRGEPGIIRESMDAKSGVLVRKALFPARPGRDVYLTLDSVAQRRAEEVLEGQTGAVVVMDIRTGELLVLASSPKYDTRDLAAELARSRADPQWKPFLSRATQDSVPSGSIIKPIVALAGAANGVSPNITFDCEGSMTLSGVQFNCSGRHGRIAMSEAITHSCNIYFWLLGRRIGAEAVSGLAGQLGLGRRTAVDLPNEKAGRLPGPARPNWRVGDTMNLCVGQGDLSVTPLQVAVVMAAIAAGGEVLQPTILLRAEPLPDPELLPRLSSPVVREVPLSAEGLRAVRDGMRNTAISGTARGIPGLVEMRVACKTGTAETPDPKINHAWLAGYVPWDRPRYAFAVVLHRVPGHGGTEAGPPAAAVLESLLRPDSGL